MISLAASSPPPAWHPAVNDRRAVICQCYPSGLRAKSRDCNNYCISCTNRVSTGILTCLFCPFRQGQQQGQGIEGSPGSHPQHQPFRAIPCSGDRYQLFLCPGRGRERAAAYRNKSEGKGSLFEGISFCGERPPYWSFAGCSLYTSYE